MVMDPPVSGCAEVQEVPCLIRPAVRAEDDVVEVLASMRTVLAAGRVALAQAMGPLDDEVSDNLPVREFGAGAVVGAATDRCATQPRVPLERAALHAASGPYWAKLASALNAFISLCRRLIWAWRDFTAW